MKCIFVKSETTDSSITGPPRTFATILLLLLCSHRSFPTFKYPAEEVEVQILGGDLQTKALAIDILHVPEVIVTESNMSAAPR
jgi:hypothetical protein